MLLLAHALLALFYLKNGVEESNDQRFLTLALRQPLKGFAFVKADSHDPVFGANYYSDLKKLVMRMKVSMS